MTTKSVLVTGTWLDQGLRPEVQRYRRELLDRIFRPFALFGFVALTFGAWRAIQDGQWVFAAVYFACYVTGTAVAIGFKRMSVQRRSDFLLIGLLALALAALLRLGLGGVGTLVLVAVCGLTGILRGFRASLVAVGVAFVMIGAVGVAMVTGAIVLPPTQLQTSLIPGAWVGNAISFVAITAGLIIPTHALSGKLTQSVSELEASNERLRREIERREEAEAASRVSELRYRGMFESATVGIMEQDWSALREILEELEEEGVEDLGVHLDMHPEHVKQAVSAVQVRDVNPAILEIFGAESQDELL
ncbi:MAG: PAS domain-containing protein, partial [Deltaproteobacteria bacterium]|nr:PAS domain-containing protein [Deltaproteobacteria bacterium]